MITQIHARGSDSTDGHELRQSQNIFIRRADEILRWKIVESRLEGRLEYFVRCDGLIVNGGDGRMLDACQQYGPFVYPGGPGLDLLDPNQQSTQLAIA